MRYKNALEFVEKNWPALARWLEQQIGPRNSEPSHVIADLAVMDRDSRHLFLVQAGLLVWIANGRPHGSNNWANSKKEVTDRFLAMSSDALEQYLKDTQDSMAPQQVPTPSIPPRPNPVVQPASLPAQAQTRNPQPWFQDVVQAARTPPTPAARPFHVVPQLNRSGAQPVPIPSRHAAVPPSQQVPASPQILHPVGRTLPTPPARTLPTVPVSNRSGFQPAPTPRQPAPVPPARQLQTMPQPPARPRRISRGPALTRVNAEELIGTLEAMQELKTLMIADISLGRFGFYLTEKTTNQLAEQPKILLGRMENPEGWISLGRAVLTHKVGKCWSCAAAAIYKLVVVPEFDLVRFESVGATNNDHHFVVVNRDPGTDVTDISTWNADAFVVDLWQANLHGWHSRQPGSPTQSQLCWKPDEYPYKESPVKLYCAFEPADRARVKDSVQDVGKQLQGQAIAHGLKQLQTCYNEHFLKGQRSATCTCSGWCDRK